MIERYYRELLNFLSRKVADRGTAADLTQESYARLYAAQASGSVVSNPRALLYQTARNLVIDHLRHRAVRNAVELASDDGAPPETEGPRSWEPETALASRQGVEALVETISGLPPRCREAFLLNRFEGLTYAQVAARMGVSTKTVEEHIKVALKACSQCRDRSRQESVAATASAVHDAAQGATPARGGVAL